MRVRWTTVTSSMTPAHGSGDGTRQGSYWSQNFTALGPVAASMRQSGERVQWNCTGGALPGIFVTRRHPLNTRLHSTSDSLKRVGSCIRVLDL